MLVTKLTPLVVCLFSWEVENTFYYLAVKSPITAFAEDFRFEVVIRLFRGNDASITFGWNKSFVNGSEMFANGIVENTELNLSFAK